MLDLESMTLIELKELAKEHNIKNISKLKKDELIAILQQITNKTNENSIKTEEKEVVERQYDENRRTYCRLQIDK